MATETGPIGVNLNPTGKSAADGREAAARDAALPYIKQARNILGMMRLQVQNGNLQYLKREVRLEDGTLITAWIDGALDRVEIVTSEPEPVGVVLCVPWLAGLTGDAVTDAGEFSIVLYESLAKAPENPGIDDEPPYQPYYFSAEERPEDSIVLTYDQFITGFEDPSLVPWYPEPLYYGEVDWSSENLDLPTVSFHGPNTRYFISSEDAPLISSLPGQALIRFRNNVYMAGRWLARTQQLVVGAALRLEEQPDETVIGYLYVITTPSIEYAFALSRLELPFLPLTCYNYDTQVTPEPAEPGQPMYEADAFELLLTFDTRDSLDLPQVDPLFMPRPTTPWFFNSSATKACVVLAGGYDRYVLELDVDQKRLTVVVPPGEPLEAGELGFVVRKGPLEWRSGDPGRFTTQWTDSGDTVTTGSGENEVLWHGQYRYTFEDTRNYYYLTENAPLLELAAIDGVPPFYVERENALAADYQGDTLVYAGLKFGSSFSSGAVGGLVSPYGFVWVRAIQDGEPGSPGVPGNPRPGHVRNYGAGWDDCALPPDFGDELSAFLRQLIVDVGWEPGTQSGAAHRIVNGAGLFVPGGPRLDCYVEQFLQPYVRNCDYSTTVDPVTYTRSVQTFSYLDLRYAVIMVFAYSGSKEVADINIPDPGSVNTQNSRFYLYRGPQVVQAINLNYTGEVPVWLDGMDRFSWYRVEIIHPRPIAIDRFGNILISWDSNEVSDYFDQNGYLGPNRNTLLEIDGADAQELMEMPGSDMKLYPVGLI